MTSPTLTKYQALSFDCYGTLIDWETGILNQLLPWSRRNGLNTASESLIGHFGQFEREVEQEFPGTLYPQILEMVHQRIAVALGIECSPEDARLFGESVGDWPVFEETVNALQALGQHFKLYILSNIDKASFALSHKKLVVEFDGIITAEDVLSYKPDARNFETLLDLVSQANIDRSKLLHVGESVFHDVVPAIRQNIDVAWINRAPQRSDVPRASGAIPAKVNPTFTFPSLQALADYLNTTP